MNAPILRSAAVAVAALGLLAPSGFVSAAEVLASKAPQAAAESMISDVSLGVGGTLHGQVVDSTGAAAGGVTVMVRQQDNLLAQAVTDAAGKFEIAGVPGGVFQIATDRSEASFRLWAAETAPPSARPAVLVVQDQAAVRGQSALSRVLSRPLVVAGIVAAAVAIPIAVHQIDIEHHSGS